jgi:hypothetical protein
LLDIDNHNNAHRYFVEPLGGGYARSMLFGRYISFINSPKKPPKMIVQQILQIVKDDVETRPPQYKASCRLSARHILKKATLQAHLSKTTRIVMIYKGRHIFSPLSMPGTLLDCGGLVETITRKNIRYILTEQEQQDIFQAGWQKVIMCLPKLLRIIDPSLEKSKCPPTHTKVQVLQQGNRVCVSIAFGVCPYCARMTKPT